MESRSPRQVRRAALRNLHPLGALRQLRPGRMVSAAERHQDRDLRTHDGRVLSVEVRREGVGASLQGRGRKVRDDHLAPPRRLFSLADKGRRRLQHRQHSLQARHPRRAFEGVRRGGAAAQLLLLAHGLAQEGLSGRDCRRQVPWFAEGRLRIIQEVHAWPDQRAHRQLPPGQHLVRRRVGACAPPERRHMEAHA